AMSPDSLRWRPPDKGAIDAFYRTGAAGKLGARMRLLGDLARRISRSKGEVEWPIPDRKVLCEFDAQPTGHRGPARGPRLPSHIPGREAVYHLLRQERAQIHGLIEEALEEMDSASRELLLRELGVFCPGRDKQTFQVYGLNFAEREDGSGSMRRDFILSFKSD